jgi:hypothetical protein
MMNLFEYVNPGAVQSKTIVEEAIDPNTGASSKNLYLKGICIQGAVRNANQRIYPTHEINKAISEMTRLINMHGGILGEADHPADLKINLDRISHVITEVWMECNDGYGKMKILPTPMGNLVKVMLESGVKLGVSSRGSGNVNESTGHVSDFEIITVDIVANPSAPQAYPRAIYESLMNMKGGNQLFEMAKDKQAQKYIKEEISKLIRDLKLS